MNAKTSKFSRSAGLMAGTFFALATVYAATAPATEESNFDFDGNFIKVAYQPTTLSGSKSAFEANTQHSRTGANGIEQLRFDDALGKDGKLSFDGKALTGTNDYSAILKLSKEDTGTVELGFKRFRTTYDGVGGFFPTNGAWMPLADAFLAVDRQKIWADFLLAQEDRPVFHLRYTNETRTGRKDSTIWGQTDFTGITIYSNSNLAPRAIVPGYIDLDERQQTLEGSVKKAFGNTTVEAGFIGSKVDNIDTRHTDRYPGELKPFPVIASTPVTVVPAAKANNAIWGYDAQGINTTGLQVYGKFETVFNEKVSLFGGAKYEKVSGDVLSDRQMTANLATVKGTVTAVGIGAIPTANMRYVSSYTTLDGAVDTKKTAANLGVNLKLIPDLYITAAGKVEELNIKAKNNVAFIGNIVTQATGAVLTDGANADNWSRTKETSWTPEVNVRYNGIRTVSIYGAADYRYVPDADEKTSNTTASVSGTRLAASLSSAHDNVSENHGHYKVGASWAPHPMVVFRGEGFIKDHVNSFNEVASTGSFVLSYMQKGGMISAAVTPFPTVTFTTKLVSQKATSDVAVDGGADYQSNDTQTNLIGETIDWTPTKDFYLQGNLNVAFDSTITSYPRAGGSANWVLHNANNDYWNGSAIFGMVIDKYTDGQLQYTCYHGNNYQPALAATTMAYGASQSDYSVTVGLKHKFTEKLIGEAKVGYFHSTNDTTGGYANYQGTIGYVSLAYAF